MSMGEIISALMKYGERLEFQGFTFLSDGISCIETTAVYIHIVSCDGDYAYIDRDGFEIEPKKFEEAKEKEKIRRSKKNAEEK